MRQRFTFQDVIDAIGEEAACALITRYGGTTIEIPAKAKPGGVFDELAETIGDTAARHLVKFCARIPLFVPRNAAKERNRRDVDMQARFDALTAGGLTARKTVSQLAREFRIVESTVWRALKRSPQTT